MAARLRPVLHRAALSEMVVPYGHPGGGHFRKNAFDVGEYGIGVLANSLTLGCDCLGAIRYFDAWLADSKGDPYCIESAVCLHEEDFGILWKHTDLFTGEVEVRRARRLVVSSISTIGNYEYGSFWYFHQDGSIHFEMKATGIMNTAGLMPGESPDYGTIVSPGVYAHYHQHVFNMRLDMAVDGERNRVVEVDTVALPSGPDNPHGNAFTLRETVLATELRAQRNVDFNAARFWQIESAEARNGLGQPTAYKLLQQARCRPSPARNRGWPGAPTFMIDSSGSPPIIPTRFTPPAAIPTRAAAATGCRPGPPPTGRWSIPISSSGTASACTIFPAPRISRCSP